MTMGSGSAEGGEASDSPVPLRVEAPKSTTPRSSRRKRKIERTTSAIPKKSKGFSSTVPATEVVDVDIFTYDCFVFVLLL